jgi:hypothetical protein
MYPKYKDDVSCGSPTDSPSMVRMDEKIPQGDSFMARR